MTESSALVLDAIRRIVQALRVSSRRSEAAVGLSGAQLFVLQTVAGAPGPLSLSQVAERTLTHLSSVSVVVGRLVDGGLLAKHAAAADARRSEISLTAKGKKFLAGQPATAQEALIAALGRLPAKDCAQLARLLGRVIADADLGGGEAPMFFEDEKK